MHAHALHRITHLHVHVHTMYTHTHSLISLSLSLYLSLSLSLSYTHSSHRAFAGVPHAIMLEFPTFGSLHTFLVCKRRGRISRSSNPWGGLQLELPLDSLVLALPEGARESLSPLLDDPVIRKRPFEQMLKEPICDVDQLLFALQIAHAMQFLASNGVS